MLSKIFGSNRGRREREAEQRAREAEQRARDHLAELEKARLAEETRAREAEQRAQEHLAELEKTRLAEEEARRRHREEAERLENARKMAEEQAQEQAKKAKEAEEAAKRANEERKKAEEQARAAAKERDDAQRAQAEAEKKRTEGIRPVVWPTPEELEAVKKARQYKEGLFHFAVAGISGSGKSSIINAIRGIANQGSGAAPTGVVECTREIARYPDENPLFKGHFVWYDVPGTGTLKVQDWTYFNSQGLYIFDCILVLIDNRFTDSDIAIIRNCIRWGLPFYIVRSKSDQHIRNLVNELREGDEENNESRVEDEYYALAKKQYVPATRQNIIQNLEEAKLPTRDVYLVSSTVLRNVVKKATKKMTGSGVGMADLLSFNIGSVMDGLIAEAGELDERKLIRDLFRDAYDRQSIKAGAGRSLPTTRA